MVFHAVSCSESIWLLGSYVYHCSESVVLNLGQFWQLPYWGHVAMREVILGVTAGGGIW